MPVLLSDEIELPFQNVIDYTEISIKWPSSKIGPELFQYLESIPGIPPQFSSLLCIYTIISPVAASIKALEFSRRGKDRGDDRPWTRGEMHVGVRPGHGALLGDDCHHVGAAEEGEAVPPVCRNLLASQQVDREQRFGGVPAVENTCSITMTLRVYRVDWSDLGLLYGGRCSR